jgi:hypothetical protein
LKLANLAKNTIAFSCHSKPTLKFSRAARKTNVHSCEIDGNNIVGGIGPVEAVFGIGVPSSAATARAAA